MKEDLPHKVIRISDINGTDVVVTHARFSLGKDAKAYCEFMNKHHKGYRFEHVTPE